MAKTLEERAQRLEDVEDIRKLFSAHAYLNGLGFVPHLPVPYQTFDETMSFVPPAAPQDL